VKSKISLVFLLIVLLTGCDSHPSLPTSVPTEKTIPTNVPTTRTSPIKITARPRFTLIIPQTSTPIPSLTSVPKFTKTLASSDLWKNYAALNSPDEKWVAYYNFNEIKVVNLDTNIIWVLPCELFQSCNYIIPMKWSQNGETLFFGASSYLGAYPQSTKVSFFSTAGRLDVQTGKWQRLFPDPVNLFDFSISFDDTYLAYIQPLLDEQFIPRSVVLTVLNLKNQQEQKTTLDSTGYGGNIVWSPYKERFVFQIRDSNNGLSSIVYFDVGTNILRYIVKDEKSVFSIQSWLENNLVLIQKTDLDEQNLVSLFLNPFTSEFSVVSTATPTP
jgi:hypothetical protein